MGGQPTEMTVGALMDRFAVEWARQVEYAVTKEPTRGIVDNAVRAVGGLAYLDIPRAIRIAKIVLRRYRNKNGPGMAKCRLSAEALIFDIHIHCSNSEADKFAASIMASPLQHAETIKQLVARYSDFLLKGSFENPSDTDHAVRKKTLAFYRSVTEGAFSEIETRAAALDIRKFNFWPADDQDAAHTMFSILDEVSIRLYFAAGRHDGGPRQNDKVSAERTRLYWEARDIFERLTGAIVAPTAHHLIQALETFIPLDPSGVFALIAQSVHSADRGGYSFEAMAANLIVRIVERYLADFRTVFADKNRLNDLMDCLDIFVRAGWPAAQSLTFKLGEIWR
jgi:hypothetical protein